jgi:hypothetical protein
MNFLLVYDRSKGELLSMTEIADHTEALRARFDAEKRHRDDASIEIVVLSASSEADIRHTHARYFEDFGQLTRGMAREFDRVSRSVLGRTAEPPHASGLAG